MSDNARSALLMIAAMAGFTINDAFLKAVLVDIPLHQALLIRGLMTIVALGLLAYRMGALKLALSSRDRRAVALRTVGEVGALGLFLTALANMPFANATAILQSVPLVLTLAGALFLGEPIGWRRLAAILLGFAGVMMIVRPGTEGFTVYSLYALGAVVFVTLRDLATRGLSREVPSLTVALTAAVGATAFGAVGSLTGDWVAMKPAAMWQLFGSAVSITMGYVCSVAMMRVGELSFVAPFRYTALLFALLLGLVVFGEWPDALTLAGAAIIAGTGLFTLWREGRRGGARRVIPKGPV